MPRPLRCHRCRSGSLILREAHLEWGEWTDGLVVDDAGRIFGTGEAFWSPGDPQPQTVEIQCQDCGHEWHPRREFVGSASLAGDYDATTEGED